MSDRDDETVRAIRTLPLDEAMMATFAPLNDDVREAEAFREGVMYARGALQRPDLFEVIDRDDLLGEDENDEVGDAA